MYTLKVGDKIARKHGKITRIYTISRVTSTQAIAKAEFGEIRFKNPVSNAEYFQRIGDDAWSRESFKVADVADIEKFEFEKMRETLVKTNWNNVSDELVKTIFETLTKNAK